MEFRTTQNNSNQNRANQTKSSALNYKTGTVTRASAELLLPKPVSAKLNAISQQYALPLDISKISLAEATPENVKALRTITNLMSNNSQLLPEILKLIKQLLKAEMKLADFHKKLTKAALEHQEEMDKTTADIFLQMAGYVSHGAKLQHRTNTRNDLITKRNEAYENHYQNSVFGDASRIIDAEYQLMASDSKVFADAKIKRKESASARKQAARAYIDSAFAS